MLLQWHWEKRHWCRLLLVVVSSLFLLCTSKCGQFLCCIWIGCTNPAFEELRCLLWVRLALEWRFNRRYCFLLRIIGSILLLYPFHLSTPSATCSFAGDSIIVWIHDRCPLFVLMQACPSDFLVAWIIRYKFLERDSWMEVMKNWYDYFLNIPSCIKADEGITGLLPVRIWKSISTTNSTQLGQYRDSASSSWWFLPLVTRNPLTH